MKRKATNVCALGPVGTMMKNADNKRPKAK